MPQVSELKSDGKAKPPCMHKITQYPQRPMLFVLSGIDDLPKDISVWLRKMNLFPLVTSSIGYVDGKMQMDVRIGFSNPGDAMLFKLKWA